MFQSRENDFIWFIAGLAVFIIATVIQKILTKRADKSDRMESRMKKVFIDSKTVLEGVKPEVAEAIVVGLQTYLQAEENKRFVVRRIEKTAWMRK